MTQKEMALNFLQMASSGQVKAAYDKFVATDFIHHNQYFKGDRQSLLEAMESAAVTHPNKSLETKIVLEEGRKVMTYSHVKSASSDNPDVAVVHIFRFENQRIAELWDLGQPVDPQSPNDNGLF